MSKSVRLYRTRRPQNNPFMIQWGVKEKKWFLYRHKIDECDSLYATFSPTNGSDIFVPYIHLMRQELSAFHSFLISSLWYS